MRRTFRQREVRFGEVTSDGSGGVDGYVDGPTGWKAKNQNTATMSVCIEDDTFSRWLITKIALVLHTKLYVTSDRPAWYHSSAPLMRYS